MATMKPKSKGYLVATVWIVSQLCHDGIERPFHTALQRFEAIDWLEDDIRDTYKKPKMSSKKARRLARKSGYRIRKATTKFS